MKKLQQCITYKGTRTKEINQNSHKGTNFLFSLADPADIRHDSQSFTMIYNSSTIIYHDPADPANPPDITCIRNDPQ